jgi:exosortase
LIVAAQAVRLGGQLLSIGSAVQYSLPMAVAGLVLAVAGPAVFRELRWVFAFLFLMVPFPARVHLAISTLLQDQATAGTVHLLNLFEVAVARHGNVVHLIDSNIKIGVVEACSGLRMLTAFIIIAATLVQLVDCPRWQKAVLMLSSVVLAIVCNLLRLVVTAILYMKTDSETAERFFHDFAGLVMMPTAVVLLLVVSFVLDRLRGLRETSE